MRIEQVCKPANARRTTSIVGAALMLVACGDAAIITEEGFANRAAEVEPV